MTTKNNQDDTNLEKINHCVLIDGDFGRHELFSNLHPYTLNHINKLNDLLTFKIYSEQSLKIMNHLSNIHCHICYNSSSIQIDEYYNTLQMVYSKNISLYPSTNTTKDNINNIDYTLKFEDIISKSKCNYIWIIYGFENNYQKLLKQFKFINQSIVMISSYSWLENLKDGSNRIEYLINQKINNLIEYQFEHLSIKSESSISTSITKQSSEIKDNSNTQIKCNIDGCNKQFKDISGLKAHQSAKHKNTQTNTNENILTIIKSKKKVKQKVKCDFNNCNEYFKNKRALENHKADKHINSQSIINEQTIETIILKTKKSKRKVMRKLRTLQKCHIEIYSSLLRCPFSTECLKSDKKYLGIEDLINHIVFEHVNSFLQQKCPIGICPNLIHKCNWFDSLEHMINQHSNYLLDETIPQVFDQQLTTSQLDNNSIETESKIKIESWDLNGSFKCSYNDCNRCYWKEETLKRHQAYEHPVSLICPYSYQCQQTTTQYIGFANLRRHIFKIHAPLFSKPTCFHWECKIGEEKSFKTWSAVLRHILSHHLEAVGIIIESTNSSKKENKNILKKCSYDTCHQLFKKRETFQNHLITFHPYPLRCPYNSQCNQINPDQPYLGLMELDKHIKTIHSKQYPIPMCFDNICQNNHFSNWNSVLDHISEKHILDIKFN